MVFALFCLATPLYAATPWLHTDGNVIKDPCGNTVILRGIDLIDLGFLTDWEGGAIAMVDRLTNTNDPCGNSPGWYPRVLRIMIAPPDSVSPAGLIPSTQTILIYTLFSGRLLITVKPKTFMQSLTGTMSTIPTATLHRQTHSGRIWRRSSPTTATLFLSFSMSR